ncbi:hypothetical protein GcM3_093019 [Golovinomyces cichoracearum]|uniref:Uncharacterized protein n=1 Tax=Golovinomyces cichoracearum TaxID=62708 RepID=A0A420IG36_9PEZI|nr:hypothetical protein GcM3_093019 [Golovinomyces cichoracearum]
MLLKIGDDSTIFMTCVIVSDRAVTAPQTIGRSTLHEMGTPIFSYGERLGMGGGKDDD